MPVRRAGPARRLEGQEGAVLVIVTIFVTVMVGMGAVVIDLAGLRQNRTNDRRTSDLMATAAATVLAAPSANGVTACQAAWDYFVANVGDEGDSPTVPPCSTAMSGTCNPSVARNAVGSAGPYTVTITNPVPNGSTMLTNPDVVGRPTQASNTGFDGSPCQRVGVRIRHETTHEFASVFGITSATTDSRSVGLATSRGHVPGVIALLVLDPVACNVLTASGQAKIIIKANGNKPGYITVDTSALGGTGTNNCTTGGRYALDALGIENSAIIAESSTASGQSGVIHMFALAPGNGAAQAYEPADLAAGRVSPQPTLTAEPVTRAPVDWVYNCKIAGRDGVVGTVDDCRFTDTRSAYIDQLITSLGGPGAPSGYGVFPRAGHPEDACSTVSGGADITLPTGDWFVNCPGGFTIKNNVKFNGGNVVFAGTVQTQSQGKLVVGTGNDRDAVVYIRSGNLVKDAQSSLVLNRSTVYIRSGVIDLAAGSGTLQWVAPLGGNFKNLALWSESSAQHVLGGQANLTVEGVFFTPNANPFNFAGQAGDNATAAQFITYRLAVTGQGNLILQPNELRVVGLPAWGAALIR